MMWLAAQLWPFALVSLLVGFALTWWEIVRSVPAPEEAIGGKDRHGQSGAAGHSASQPRAVGHSLDAQPEAPIERPTRPDAGVEAEMPEPPRRRAVAVGEAFAPRVGEDEGMSDDFENDPYDESPVHQLDDDGIVDDDPDGDDSDDDAREWAERERPSGH